MTKLELAIYLQRLTKVYHVKQPDVGGGKTLMLQHQQGPVFNRVAASDYDMRRRQPGLLRANNYFARPRH